MSVVDVPSARRARPSRAARRVGYAVAVVVDAAMLLLVNVWPGWQSVPFLTDEAAGLMPLINATMVAGLVVNLVYVVVDPPAVRALGELLVTAVGLTALVALWRVFPFSFAGQAFDWELVARVLLLLGIAGSLVAIVVQLVTLVARAVRGHW